MRVLVVGGGVGGLTAATCLARAGVDVTLVERTPTWRPLGAGIVMAANASRLLSTLGIELGSVGRAVGVSQIRNAGGRVLQQTDLAGFAQEYGPAWALARPDLHLLLTAALADAADVRMGTALRSIDEDRDGVDVGLEVAGARYDERFDMVIGADGAKSATRNAVAGAVAMRSSGTRCWRGIVDGWSGTHTFEAWGPTARVGVVPLRGERAYYFLVAAPDEDRAGRDASAIRSRFGGYPGEAGELIQMITEAPHQQDLVELERPHWGTTRVALLGDAAHAMTPNLGQGAAMAIEDAVALTRALAPGVAGAAARYRATRHRRVRKVQLDSRRIGRLADHPSPIVRRGREAMVRAMPRSMVARQYARLVEPGLRLLPCAP